MPLPLTGTAAVENGEDLVVWTGAPLTPLNCVVGAAIALDGRAYFVHERIDTSSFTLTRTYGEADGSVPAEITQMSPEQVATATLNKRAAELFAQLDVVQANGRGLFYRFSDTVADTDPGPGYLRLNHASPGSATHIYLDNLDANDATVAAEIDTWGDSTSPIKGRLWLRSIDAPQTFHAFRVTGAVVDGSGYRKLALTWAGGSGDFGADDALMVAFQPTGDRGNDGEDLAEGKKLLRITQWTVSGTWTPDPAVTMALLIGQAPGGGGGGCTASGTGVSAGAGGGGGGYQERWISSGWGTSHPVTIGAVGAGGTSSSVNGSDGGNVSVGTLLVAAGGKGGFGGSAKVTGNQRTAGPGGQGGGATGAGGTSAGVDIILPGARGGMGAIFGVGLTGNSGPGGASAMGQGGGSVTESADNGEAGVGFGGGGGGACADTGTGGSGGNGAPGTVIIAEYA